MVFYAYLPVAPIPRIMPKEWVLKCIHALYLEKMAADEDCDKYGKPRQPFAEFTYDFFMTLFGIRKAAESVCPRA